MSSVCGVECCKLLVTSSKPLRTAPHNGLATRNLHKIIESTYSINFQFERHRKRRGKAQNRRGFCLHQRHPSVCPSVVAHLHAAGSDGAARVIQPYSISLPPRSARRAGARRRRYGGCGHVGELA